VTQGPRTRSCDPRTRLVTQGPNTRHVRPNTRHVRQVWTPVLQPLVCHFLTDAFVRNLHQRLVGLWCPMFLAVASYQFNIPGIQGGMASAPGLGLARCGTARCGTARCGTARCGTAPLYQLRV